MSKFPLLATAIVCSLLFVGSSEAQVTVDYANGMLSIQCNNAALSDVFTQIETQTGVELTVEDGVKSKRLTANLVEEPLQRAIQRLLDGQGVNYVVLMDPRDWERVNKIFVGAGGGGSSRPGPARSAPPPPIADDGYGDDEMDDFNDMDEMDDFNDDFGEEAMEDMEPPADAFPPPQGANPGAGGFNYFPQNNFQRSNVTPGQPSTPPFAAPATPTNPAQPQPNQFGNPGQAAPPPATFPFTDPYGRPVPVPPGMQQNQQQQQNRQNPPQR